MKDIEKANPTECSINREHSVGASSFTWLWTEILHCTTNKNFNSPWRFLSHLLFH